MPITTAQISIVDMTDIVRQPTRPTNPSEGLVWLDTSGKAPFRFYIYTDGDFAPTDYTSLDELDPAASEKLMASFDKITELDSDGKLTRYERSVVRGEVGKITGLYLAGSAPMPTIATIDSSGVGDLHAIRQQSRDLGLPIDNSSYVRLANAYTALRTYLSGLSPKGWDIDSPETTTIVSEAWDAVWEEYAVAYNFLRVVNNQRAQQFAEEEAEAARKAAEKAAKDYADEMKETIDGDIGDVGGRVTDLNTYINESFKDGVIEEAEAKAIAKYINSLSSEKLDVDGRYTDIYSNPSLTGAPKDELLSKKGNYDTAHNSLISSINTAIADGKTTETEAADVDAKFTAYAAALAALSSAFEAAVDNIAQHKAATAAGTALEDAKKHADEIKKAIDVEIGDISDAITDLDVYIGESFRDGIIEEVEAKTIATYINLLQAEKADLDNRYGAVYTDSDLIGDPKNALSQGKTAYNNAHSSLIEAINAAIADGKTTATEKTNVDSKFATYRTALADLSTLFEQAITSIAQVKANRAQQGGESAAEQARKDAIAAVSNSLEHEVKNLTNPVTINAPIATIALPQFEGRHVDGWEMTGKTEVDGSSRIQPITTPTFRSGTSMTMLVKAYGDGVTNDLVEWDTFGNPVKIKHWEDKLLDGTYNWGVHSTAVSGFTQVIATGVASATPVVNSVQAVKYDGQYLTNYASSNLVAKDQVSISDANNLIISIAYADSGWGQTYTPTADEIKAYFNGWRMCNGTYGTVYAGSGTKTWYPIGDGDTARAETSVPTDVSYTVNENVINQYQAVYRLQDPVREVIGFDGLLNLIQGDNEISITYPIGTPEIVKGSIKYATNLATANKDIAYLIPTLQTRLASAEEIITDESIVNKVMNSVSYQVGLSSKANADELSNYATNDAMSGLADDVSGLANAVNSIDLTPYITQSELDQTATQITAKFSATGGMNLIKNSIGFSDLDFWQSVYTTPVETISKNELDILGFGSGFVFSDNGQDQGISQTVPVKPGQPYTLSWYLEKLTGGTTSAHRFYIQILEGEVVMMQLADNSSEITNGYEAKHLNYIPESSAITIRFIGGANVDATLTGIMLTIGDVPLQWSLSTGELYNTNIRMDINGIRVSQFQGEDGDRLEVGYTAITPDEFAGYALISGRFQKIFYLNGQETVTKKLRAEEEITMGSVKAVKVDSSGNKGWAFIKNSKY